MSIVGAPISAIGYVAGLIAYSFMLGFNTATNYIDKGIAALEGIRK